MQPKGGETPVCAFYDLTEWVNIIIMGSCNELFEHTLFTIAMGIHFGQMLVANWWKPLRDTRCAAVTI